MDLFKYRSCTASHNGRLGYTNRLSTLTVDDRDRVLSRGVKQLDGLDGVLSRGVKQVVPEFVAEV